MNIALIGYGKMGKAVERLAIQHNVSVVKSRTISEIKDELKVIDPDVAIEFTQPDSVVGHIRACIDLQIPIVTGTTGWNDQLGDVRSYCTNKSGSVFYASNFSIGANIFFAINKELASLLNQYATYDVTIHEVHHIEKKDQPSGTAITLGKEIIHQLDRKSSWSQDKSDQKETLLITSDRKENVKGMHEIVYTSHEDSIVIKHDAHNRDGFANGAIQAASWIVGRTGIFGMSDMLNDTNHNS